MKWLLNFLERIGRKRIVLDRQSNEPYLERYYIFIKDRKHFPFNIFLHRFLKSDPDDLHDHPWNYATLILKGGYWEVIPTDCGPIRFGDGSLNTKKVWRGPGHFRMCAADTFHRVELDPNVECWTLFMPGKQKREWGFDVRGHWIQNEEYIEARKQT